MKCIKNNQAASLYSSNSCIKSCLICQLSPCTCQKSHGLIMIEDIKNKISPSNQPLKSLTHVLAICKQIIEYLKAQTYKIQKFIQQNTHSSEEQEIDNSSPEKNQQVSNKQFIKTIDQKLQTNVNQLTINQVTKILQTAKLCFEGIWKPVNAKRSPRELFPRLNRKIQNKRNLQYLHLNHVNIVPIPQTFDITNLTGVRLVVIDDKIIQLLSIYCKNLRRLQIYEQHTLKDKHVFQIAKVLQQLVYVSFNSQNITKPAIIKIARNLKSLKSFVLFSKYTTMEIKSKFKILSPCKRVSM